MTAGFGLRIALMALAAAFAPAAAGAQNAADTAPPPAQDVIGPDQLRDFSLNGTVTRPAEPQPIAPAAPDPAPSRPSPSTTARQAPPAADSEAPAPRVSTELPQPLPSPTDADSQPVPGPAFGENPAEPAPLAPSAAASDDGIGLLPWLLAGLAAALGLGFYVWRQRSWPAYAGPQFDLDRPAPEPQPAPRVPAPAPAPAPSPPPSPPAVPPARPAAEAAPLLSPAGIVSTRLRPWLEIELTPLRCVYSAEQAAIEFQVAIFNSGSAPARDVLIEAQLFNGGSDQEQALAAFFAHPRALGERLAELGPLKRVGVRSSVAMPHAQLRAFPVAERLLWVPTLAINALYRFGDSEGQTGASFIIGRLTPGEKMAGLRLDQGPRVFRGLGARLHTVGVRK